MIEENRGFIGTKTSLSKFNGSDSSYSIGIFDSKTAITQSDKLELFKYCELGLAGSNISSSNGMSIFLVNSSLSYKSIRLLLCNT